MKIFRALFVPFVFLFFTVSIFNSCTKEETLPPAVKTTAVSSVGARTATSGGIITSYGGSDKIQKGVCWSTVNPPSLSDYAVITDTSSDVFICNISDLTPNTTYYLSAFATNRGGTGYGEVMSFTTLALATVKTTEATTVAIDSAVCGGVIEDDAGKEILEKGICWSTETEPTLENSYSPDAVGADTFYCNLTGLQPATKYFVRAYATTQDGTAYGNEITFTTLEGAIDADGNVYAAITFGEQIWLIENLKTSKYNDGSEILMVTSSERWAALSDTAAFCWYNNDEATFNTYGALYNWHAIQSGKLAPKGYHIATQDEWETLQKHLVDNGFGFEDSGDDIAKAMASKTDWLASTVVGSPGYDIASNNSSGFSALPAGSTSAEGTVNGLQNLTIWWTASSFETDTSDFAHSSSLTNESDLLLLQEMDKNGGFSVRCVKD